MNSPLPRILKICLLNSQLSKHTSKPLVHAHKQAYTCNYSNFCCIGKQSNTHTFSPCFLLCFSSLYERRLHNQQFRCDIQWRRQQRAKAILNDLVKSTRVILSNPIQSWFGCRCDALSSKSRGQPDLSPTKTKLEQSDQCFCSTADICHQGAIEQHWRLRCNNDNIALAKR